MENNVIKETVVVICKVCNQNVELKPCNLKRLKNRFGKDPMTYIYECPKCHRINYLGYKALIDANPHILYTLYNVCGDNPWDDN